LIAKNAFARALTAATVPIVEALEPRTPSTVFDGESFSFKSTGKGTLSGSIVTDVAIDSKGRGGRAQVGFGRQGFKARMVEFGHRMIGHKPGLKDTGKVVRAHPFMRPAAATSGDAAIEAFTDSMRATFAAKQIPGLRTD
jgi:hypothetical protein